MIIDIIFFLGMMLFMFLPTFIAYSRDHKNADACLWINLFLGWIIIFWLPLLVWSLVSRTT